MAKAKPVFNYSTTLTSQKEKKIIPPAVDDSVTESLSEKLNNEIKVDILVSSVFGLVALGLCIFSAIYLFNDIKKSIDEHLALFGFGTKANKDNLTQYPTQAAAILIFRYTALATIATTILIVGLKMAIASFDQSVRYSKRKLSSIFLQFLYKTHLPQMVDKVTVPQLMQAFETWTQNVESAFSKISVEQNRNRTPRRRKLKTDLEE